VLWRSSYPSDGKRVRASRKSDPARLQRDGAWRPSSAGRGLVQGRASDRVGRAVRPHRHQEDRAVDAGQRAGGAAQQDDRRRTVHVSQFGQRCRQRRRTRGHRSVRSTRYQQVVKGFRREAASQNGQIFRGKTLTRHRPIGSNAAVGCSSHADAVIDFFAAYTAAVTHGAFQCDERPPKIATGLWGIWALSNINCSLGPLKSTN